MPTTTRYPSGQALVSSALTPTQLNVIMQTQTCGMLGIIPVDPAQVRISWQQQGQPDVAQPTQDSCYITCVPENVEYRLVRDRTFTGTGPVVENWNYTRGVRVSWDLYGPNSTDRARQIYSALFMDYFNDQFSLMNLYPVLDCAEPVRVPIEHNAQWFDHSYFYCIFYEAITETIADGAVTSLEIKVNDSTGQVADVTITT